MTSHAHHLTELSPETAYDGLRDRRLTLIDVREPAEYAAERINGALLFPLSTFDPNALPNDPARPIVFYCCTGQRSANAVRRCAQIGLPFATHMKGGISTWKAAGLPTVSVEPATGAVVDRR